ncbi:hypothetical protein MBRU_12890 [Mycolicibacterium brumae DSM 44177]|nr:hypothetical protein MBRU_12890 [Mycolicibacterium brumae DSM 44177]
MGFSRDRPAPLAADHRLAAIGHQRAGGHEPGAAPLVGHIGQLRQQQLVIGDVVAVATGPARRQHPRHPVQRVDGEPRVICHTGDPGGVEAVTRFGQRVPLEVGGGLRGLRVGRHVVQGQQLELHLRGVEHAAQFGEFLAVAGGDQQLRHRNS